MILTHTVVSPAGSVGSQLVCHWQTLTPHAEINGNGWIPPGRKFQPFLLADPLSHDLVHKISHLFGGLLLLLAGGVGVGSQRESGVVVAQHGGNGFHIYAVLECGGRKSVTKCVKIYITQSC